MKEKISQIVAREASLLSGCDDWPIFSIPEVNVRYGTSENEGDIVIPLAMELEKTVQKPAKTIAGVIVKQLVHNQELLSCIKEYRIDDQGNIHGILHDHQIQEMLYSWFMDAEKGMGEGCGALSILPFDMKKGEKADIWGWMVHLNFLEKAHRAIGKSIQTVYVFDENEKLKQEYAEMITVMFLKKQGVNIALPGILSQNTFLEEIEEIATNRIGMKELKLTNSTKMEEVRKNLEKEVIKTLQEKITDFKDRLGIHVQEYRTSELYKDKELIRRLLDILQRENCLYIKKEALYAVTSRFGDNEDRMLANSEGVKTLFFAEVLWIFWLNNKLSEVEILIDEKNHKRAQAMKQMLQLTSVKFRTVLQRKEINYKEKNFSYKIILDTEEEENIYTKCEEIHVRINRALQNYKHLDVSGKKACIIHKEERELVKFVAGLQDVCRDQIREHQPKVLEEYVKGVTRIAEKVYDRGEIMIGDKVHIAQWMTLSMVEKLCRNVLELCIKPYENRN